jgi:Bacterial Ig-like domain (group 3)
MSEKIYAWLLRLYPSSFQRAYGEEALQLFRDRARDERGFISSLRLWLDLLGDLAISLPREYRSASAAVVVSQAPYLSDGTPSFHTLDVEVFSFRSLFCGGVVSLVVYGSILVLIGHGGSLLANPARDSQRTQRSSKTIPTRPPTIIFSYVPAKPASGSMVRLTATVSAVGGPTPTGNVRFLDGITVLNLGELDNGTVTVKGKLPYSATHILRATYLGDVRYSPVSSTEKKQ